MYSTKTIHKNINPNYPQTYTSIGDPYKSSIDALPSRWKKKQFVTQRYPVNAENGFFIKVQYHPEPYTELAETYTETQPLDKRKLGFGSHDAFKSGEFTSTKATERYRDLVKRECTLLTKNRDSKKEGALRAHFKKRPKTAPKDRFGRDLIVPRNMYDVGRSRVTPYNPDNAHDSFYTLPKHASVDPKWKGKDPIRRLGPHRPMSATIGELAWGHRYGKPASGQVHLMDKFNDRGHLECRGF